MQGYLGYRKLAKVQLSMVELSGVNLQLTRVRIMLPRVNITMLRLMLHRVNFTMLDINSSCRELPMVSYVNNLIFYCKKNTLSDTKYN